MAAAALTPRVRLMAVCDGVRESKAEDGVFHLRGVRQAMTADAFPFTPRLWLFLVLSSPRAGDYPGYVRVIDDATDNTIFHSELPELEFDSDHGLAFVIARLHCSFHHEGR